MRTSREQMTAEAAEDLAAVLLDQGCTPIDVPQHGVDLVVEVPRGAWVAIEVKARAVASALPDDWLARSQGADVLVVVADVVTETARSQLRAAGAGWFDRRGHLNVPPDLDVAVRPRPRRPMHENRDALGGRAALEVALAALASNDSVGVRELARLVGMAASSISAARTQLIEELLLTSDGRPVRPNLFDLVVERWAPSWQPLADSGPGGLHDVDLVIGGDVGAVMNGAPMAVGSAAPVHYYVRTSSDLRATVATFGAADVLDARGWVAVAPSRFVLDIAHHRETMATPWLAGRVVPTVVSAIELASDPGRGREVLDAWDVPEAPWTV